jgi:hypothetical protein
MNLTRHNVSNQRWIIYLLLTGITLLFSTTGLGTEWGTILYPKQKTVIREKRSTNSRVKGKLNAGQLVRADFLNHSWYAVFRPAQKQRDEKLALGYVHASFLYRPVSQASGAPPVEVKLPAKIPLYKVNSEFSPVDVKNISFKITEDGKEILSIEFDRFYMPAMTTVQGEAPRIILSIPDILALKKDWMISNTGGKFVREIRSSLDPQTRVVRIVLHMKPSKDYSVNPAFYEKENIYSLEISEENKRQLP